MSLSCRMLVRSVYYEEISWGYVSFMTAPASCLVVNEKRKIFFLTDG